MYTDIVTVVITGVSPNSLGESLAQTIAKHSPANLILASRTKSKLEKVVGQIKASGTSVTLKFVVLDLSSQSSICESAAEISKLVDHIDILINNAAIVTSDLRHTTEGIETQFGTGHIGHFLLTNLLFPLLQAAAARSPPGATRIINVSSAGHRISPIRFHDYNFEGKQVPESERPPPSVPDKFLPKPGNPYHGFVAYGQSKTANILFAISLTEMFGNQGIKGFAVHPGCASLSPNVLVRAEREC